MVKMKKGLLISFICVITFLFGSCIKISYELKETVPSETGKKTAYIYTSAGGATTGYTTRVTISEEKDFNFINKEQYFMICDENHGTVKDFKIILEWIDDNTISVFYSKGTRFFRQEQNFNNVKINYKEISE